MGMKEKRKSKRRHLFEYFKIFNRNTGDLIGELVDITTDGIMLISESALDLEIEYPMKVELPEVMKHPHVNFDAKCVWSRKDEYSGAYENGFQLLNISPKDLEIIKSRLL